MSDEKQPAIAPPTTPAPQEPAPVEKVPAAPAPTVEAGAKSPSDGPTEPAKKEVHGLKTDLFKARAKARSAEDALRAIDERIAALERARSEPSRAKPETDTWAETQAGDESGKDANGLEKRIVNQVESLLNRREAESRLMGARAEANQWLLSREHMRSDPNAVNEIGEILGLPYYQELATHDPRAAARSAYTDWCEQRGVPADIGRTIADTPTSGARPSGGKKSEDDTVDISSLDGIPYGTKEYHDRVKAIEQAAREGKFRGKVTKL